MPRWPVQDPRDRFWSKVKKTDTCWVWMAGKSNGYGRFRLGTFTWQAHKLAWEWERGPVPPGQELDHLCRNRACVRRSHLELVTHQVNAKRQTLTRPNCARGHRFSTENTIKVKTRGRGVARRCRICQDQGRYEPKPLRHLTKGTWPGMDGPWLRAQTQKRKDRSNEREPERG